MLVSNLPQAFRVALADILPRYRTHLPIYSPNTENMNVGGVDIKTPSTIEKKEIIT